MKTRVQDEKLYLMLDKDEASILDDIIEFYAENNDRIRSESQEANFLIATREGLDKLLGTGEES